MASSEEYKKYSDKVKKTSPPTPVLKNSLAAFISGGLMCVIGEVFFVTYKNLGFSVKDARTLVSCTVILITALLTGIGIYDKLAKKAGAGLALPISGFANSVCAPAIEHSSEGFIHGTAIKMFSLAGPVIVYGSFISCVYGIIYYFLGGLI